MTHLTEVTPPLNRGGTRHYLNGKRITSYEFTRLLLIDRKENPAPDNIEHTLNRDKETLTRNHYYLKGA